MLSILSKITKKQIATRLALTSRGNTRLPTRGRVLASKMPSPKVKSDTEVILRRLRANVEAFRSEEVREQLLESSDEPEQRTIPALEAQLIKFRTTLAKRNDRIGELEKLLSDAEGNLLNEKIRAEKLETSLQTAEHERDNCAARVVELEKDHLAAAKSATENAALLSIASKSNAAQIAQLQAEVSSARSNFDAARIELDAARAKLEAETAEFEHHRELAEDERVSLQNQLDEVSVENAKLCEERDKMREEYEKLVDKISATSNKALAEVAELRAECASRAEETNSAREECMKITVEMQGVLDEVQRKDAELDALKVVQTKMNRMRREMDRARNAEEVVEALRDEKEMLCGLIAAVAPSGKFEEGVRLVKDTAFRKTLLKQGKADLKLGPSSNKYNIDDISSKLSSYADTVEKAKEETKRVGNERDAVVAELEQTKRQLYCTKKQLEALSASAGDANESTVQAVEASRARVADCERTIEQLRNAMQEKENELLRLMRREAGDADLYRDLCMVLNAQLRQSANKRRARGVNEGRVSKR